MEYLKAHPNEKLWVESDFESFSGIGVNVTERELHDFVSQYISVNKEKIMAERYKALPIALKEISANPVMKWADPKLRTQIVNQKFEDLLGPKDERDNVSAKKVRGFARFPLIFRRNQNQRRRSLLNSPLPKRLKKPSRTCSRKDGWEIYISRAEILKSRRSSWKPISKQQVGKSSPGSPPNRMDSYILGILRRSLSTLDMHDTMEESVICDMTIPILRRRKSNTSRVSKSALSGLDLSHMILHIPVIIFKDCMNLLRN